MAYDRPGNPRRDQMSPIRPESIRPINDAPRDNSRYFTRERAKNVAIDALVCAEAWELYSLAAAGLTGPGAAVVAGAGLATCVVKGLVDVMSPNDAALSAGQHVASLMSPAGMTSFGIAESAGLSLEDSLFAADLGSSFGSVSTNAFSGKPLGVSGSADFVDFTDKLAQSPEHLKTQKAPARTDAKQNDSQRADTDSIYNESGGLRTGPARTTDDPREKYGSPGSGEGGNGSIVA